MPCAPTFMQEPISLRILSYFNTDMLQWFWTGRAPLTKLMNLSFCLRPKRVWIRESRRSLAQLATKRFGSSPWSMILAVFSKGCRGGLWSGSTQGTSKMVKSICWTQGFWQSRNKMELGVQECCRAGVKWVHQLPPMPAEPILFFRMWGFGRSGKNTSFVHWKVGQPRSSVPAELNSVSEDCQVALSRPQSSHKARIWMQHLHVHMDAHSLVSQKHPKVATKNWLLRPGNTMEHQEWQHWHLENSLPGRLEISWARYLMMSCCLWLYYCCILPLK